MLLRYSETAIPINLLSKELKNREPLQQYFKFEIIFHSMKNLKEWILKIKGHLCIRPKPDDAYKGFE